MLEIQSAIDEKISKSNSTIIRTYRIDVKLYQPDKLAEEMFLIHTFRTEMTRKPADELGRTVQINAQRHDVIARMA